MPNDTNPLLSLSKISFAYRALPVLEAVDWSWQRGQQWACLGPNGAGKTTLAKLLGRQLQSASGEIWKCEEIEAGNTAYVCFELQQDRGYSGGRIPCWIGVAWCVRAALRRFSTAPRSGS